MSHISPLNYTSSIIEENDHFIHAMIAPIESKKPMCPQCGSYDVVSYGKRRRSFADLPVKGKHVKLDIDVQRYRCSSCKKLFPVDLPDMSDQYKMTERLALYVKRQSILRPFTHVADEVGLNNTTVFRLFCDYKEEIEKKLAFASPKTISLEDIPLAKQYRCVITNAEENTIVDILRDRSESALFQYLERYRHMHPAPRILIDMNEDYRQAIKGIFPDAIIKVKKQAVISLADRAVDKCRKELRDTLPAERRRNLQNDRKSVWKTEYPVLGSVYEQKEAFLAIYDDEDGQKARIRYDAWEKGLSAEIRPFFADLLQSMKNWEKEVFSSFDNPMIDHHLQSVQRMINNIDRMEKSYGFESVRAKILYSLNLHETAFSSEGNINYGTSIEKLSNMLESGNFYFEI